MLHVISFNFIYHFWWVRWGRGNTFSRSLWSDQLTPGLLFCLTKASSLISLPQYSRVILYFWFQSIDTSYLLPLHWFQPFRSYLCLPALWFQPIDSRLLILVYWFWSDHTSFSHFTPLIQVDYFSCLMDLSHWFQPALSLFTEAERWKWEIMWVW